MQTGVNKFNHTKHIKGNGIYSDIQHRTGVVVIRQSHSNTDPCSHFIT